ncbi:ABC transporter ATP-binding protein [Sphaerisporangium sp. TRM90804]|uniref:ABC transporter ATP-binding protein n=1 Tax=Sphaerisporangium sp. TRM90804 TaxID=3031113 RepID=UPI002447C16F|nr:ABC transporter ATP-binding protein [Sphaerisporangium sp. TRM90804]MDH2428082.1 ABC transporter ATP-binding protein [Sphaerisporangium sp. TRM90804]
MIRTDDLRKEFRTRRTTAVAVDGLTLEVPRGRVTGLLGLNGAGKTTTIKIMATLLHQTSGTVRVDELDPLRQPDAVRRRINLIAGGERMVYARMTGRENLWYFGRLYDVPRAVLRGRVEELLELVGLTAAADTTVERYSRGMAQRLSIARGLVNDPAYLLLDEPTLGLDAPIARDLRRLVARLAREGTGVLLTSHYLTEVEELCGHVYVIGEGRHVTAGSPAELTARAGCHRTVRIRLAERSPGVEAAVAAFAARLGTDAGLEPADDGGVVVSLSHPDDVAGPLAMAVVAAGGTLAGLEVAEPSLEDAILALADAPRLVTA